MVKEILTLKTDIAKIANDDVLGESVEIGKNQWRDGLIIRTPNWLGDAVMCLPAIKMLRTVVPKDCAIFAITVPGLAQLFESVEIIDRVVVLDSAHRNWSRTNAIRVRQTNSGVGILFNNSFRDAFFMRLALPFSKIYGSGMRLGWIFLNRSFKFPELFSKEHHHASRYISIARALGAEKWDGRFPELRDLKEPEITSSEILEFLNKEKILVVAPGAAYGPAKKWSEENFASVCKYWIEEEKGNVAILAGKNEFECAERITKIVSSSKVANFAGKTDIRDLIKILRKANFCISNDSGVMHLAAGIGCAGVAIFGSTNPYATSPLSEKWIALYSAEECSPCFERVCRYGHYNCLKNISSEIVIKKMREMLGSDRTIKERN